MAPGAALCRVAALLCCLLPAAASAQSPPQAVAAAPATVIVIVDANRIQRDSLAGRGVGSERERYQQSFNTEFEHTRKELQAAEQDLARQKSSLPPETFQDKARELNMRIAEFQRQYQGAVRALDRSSALASGELQKAIIAVTSEVASEMGAGLVLHKQQVFLHDERMDITDTVMERLNKRLASVPFAAPEVEAAAPKAPGAAKAGLAPKGQGKK